MEAKRYKTKECLHCSKVIDCEGKPFKDTICVHYEESRKCEDCNNKGSDACSICDNLSSWEWNR